MENSSKSKTNVGDIKNDLLYYIKMRKNSKLATRFSNPCFSEASKLSVIMISVLCEGKYQGPYGGKIDAAKTWFLLIKLLKMQ